MGRHLRARRAARAATTTERHLDRRLLPHLRSSARDHERQRLHRLRRTRRPDTAHPVSAVEQAPRERGAGRGAKSSRCPPTVPPMSTTVEPKSLLDAHSADTPRLPKPCVAGSNPAGGTQVRTHFGPPTAVRGRQSRWNVCRETSLNSPTRDHLLAPAAEQGPRPCSRARLRCMCVSTCAGFSAS